jgi:hypothetical protein
MRTKRIVLFAALTALMTLSVAVRPVPAQARARRQHPSTYVQPGEVGITRSVRSTSYCLRGGTSSGQPVGSGVVAMNGFPFGTVWLVTDGPMAGQTLTVWDRIGRGSQFDVWIGDCAAARQYGRRQITIVRVA